VAGQELKVTVGVGWLQPGQELLKNHSPVVVLLHGQHRPPVGRLKPSFCAAHLWVISSTCFPLDADTLFSRSTGLFAQALHFSGGFPQGRKGLGCGELLPEMFRRGGSRGDAT